MTSRIFSPLELNHLRKFGYADVDLASLGNKPVEYVTGHAEFYHLDFLVNEHTLIPRLESEKIIDLALEHISKEDLAHPAIADIGTGSGCLGFSLAVILLQKHIPYTLYLSDISQDALQIAKTNASRLLSSSANLFFEQSDLLENFPHIRFDLLIANLPYIPTQNISVLSPSVKDHEPHLALDGGPSGTHLINKLLSDLPDFLSERGLAILEIDDTHSLKDFTFSSDLSAHLEKDFFGVPRFLVIHQKD